MQIEVRKNLSWLRAREGHTPGQEQCADCREPGVEPGTNSRERAVAASRHYRSYAPRIVSRMSAVTMSTCSAATT